MEAVYTVFVRQKRKIRNSLFKEKNWMLKEYIYLENIL